MLDGLQDEGIAAASAEDVRIEIGNFLAEVAEEFGLELISIVSDNGKCVAGPSGFESRAAELAALAPQLASGPTGAIAREPQLIARERVSALEFWSNGLRFYAVAVSSDRNMREIWVFRAIFGVRRIQQSAKKAFI